MAKVYGTYTLRAYMRRIGDYPMVNPLGLGFLVGTGVSYQVYLSNHVTPDRIIAWAEMSGAMAGVTCFLLGLWVLCRRHKDPSCPKFKWFVAPAVLLGLAIGAFAVGAALSTVQLIPGTAQSASLREVTCTMYYVTLTFMSGMVAIPAALLLHVMPLLPQTAWKTINKIMHDRHAP
jgi:hypothetical protein